MDRDRKNVSDVRERDRLTDGQTDRQKDRQTDKHTELESEGVIERGIVPLGKKEIMYYRLE